MCCETSRLQPQNMRALSLCAQQATLCWNGINTLDHFVRNFLSQKGEAVCPVYTTCSIEFAPTFNYHSENLLTVLLESNVKTRFLRMFYNFGNVTYTKHNVHETRHLHEIGELNQTNSAVPNAPNDIQTRKQGQIECGGKATAVIECVRTPRTSLEKMSVSKVWKFVPNVLCGSFMCKICKPLEHKVSTACK